MGQTMDLLRKIAIGNGNQIQKDAATAAMARKDRQIIANWNKELEAEVWQKILDRIERRGYTGIGKNSTATRSGDKVQNARQTP